MLRNWDVGLSERIDPAREQPIYMQIIQAVIRDIESGRLASGSYLPSSRDLARMLGVNRKTVVLAYEDLIAQGWLATAGTRGTMVSAALPEAPAHRAAEQAGPARAGYPFYAPSSAPAPDRGPKLDEGSPDGRLFPPEPLARAYRNAAHRISANDGLGYRDPRGSPRLRATIADMLRTQRGLPVGEENVCITRGSQNGVFLAGQVLLQPGDAVIVEELTYRPAAEAFAALGARVVPVGLDEGGIDLSEVEDACRKHAVRAIFVTPHHQFPTTVALTPQRRLQLVELGRQFGFAIIEDDYDHEFHFEHQPLLPIAAYAPGQVLYVGSLSKLLLPALRIGYIAAPAPVIEAVAHRVSLTDGMGNTLTEEAAAELIANGELRRHARKAKQVYAGRRQDFVAEIDRVLGPLVRYRVPEGGLAFWLRFERGLDRLEERAAAMGLRFAPSQSFRMREQAPRGLRLGFASLAAEERDAALHLLRQAAG